MFVRHCLSNFTNEFAANKLMMEKMFRAAVKDVDIEGRCSKKGESVMVSAHAGTSFPP